jgi:RHS repeat-associated protein
VDVKFNDLGQTTEDYTFKNGELWKRNYEYDAVGRLIGVNVTRYDTNGNQIGTGTGGAVNFDYMPGSRMRFAQHKLFGSQGQSIDSLVHTLSSGGNEIELSDDQFNYKKIYLGDLNQLDLRFGFVERQGDAFSYDDPKKEYVFDHQNSTNALLSDDTLVAEKLYEPNGVPVVLLPEHMSVDDFTYTGRSYIPEVDLHYYRGRYMSSCSNRFTQQDPMQHGSNWYAYTANPVMMVDPTGYAFKDFYDPAMEEILSIFDIKQVGYGLILEQILKFAGPFGTLYTIYNTSVAGYELYQNWGCMTPEQYHAFAGRLVGGKIKDAILGRAKLQAGTLARKGWNRLKSSFRRLPSIGGPSSMGLLPDGKKGSPKKKKKTGDGIRTINGRRPINSKYAGKTHPSGVKFTDQGFPDFSPYAKAKAKLEGLTGDYRTDSDMANAAVGLEATPAGMVWHHVEDGMTMLLVPQAKHQAVRHTGGAAVIRYGFD